MLKRALTFTLYEYLDIGTEIRIPSPLELEFRRTGRDWPTLADSMIGHFRMDNIQQCLNHVIEDDIEGDVIEAGVWRGGASIFMRGILKSYASNKIIYVADYFSGLPAPSKDYPQDAEMNLHTFQQLSIPLEQVQMNFDRYGMLDGQVVFVPGLFKDTLHHLNDRQWSLIRLDGDMYESTMQSMEALYPQLSVGGYLIQDDYFQIPQAKQATDDYRDRMGISTPIEQIDWAGGYWRKGELNGLH